MSKDEVDSIIFERQQIMTQLDKDTVTLGEIVSGELPKDMPINSGALCDSFAAKPG